MYADFFYGPVSFLELEKPMSGYERVKYNIDGREHDIISVHAAVHIRLLSGQPSPESLPSKFDIIAPMEAVKLLRGEINPSYKKFMDHTKYLELRMKYIGV